MDGQGPHPWMALGLAPDWPLAWPLAGPWPGPGWPLAWPWLALGLALGWRYKFCVVPAW